MDFDNINDDALGLGLLTFIGYTYHGHATNTLPGDVIESLYDDELLGTDGVLTEKFHNLAGEILSAILEGDDDATPD